MRTSSTAPRVGAWVMTAILLGLLSGCARLTLMTTDDLATEIDQAIESGDYRLANYLITHTAPDHPQAEQVNARAEPLRESIARFQQKTRAEALEYASQQDWHSALQTLRQAERSLPRQDEVIPAAREELADSELRSFESVESSILLDEARWLLRHQDNAEQLQAYTLREARQLAGSLDRRQETLASRLLELADRPCDSNQWQRCHDLLSVWQALSGSQQADPRLQTAATNLASAANRKRQQQVQQLRREAEKLRQRYQESGELADLLSLRQYVDSNNRHGALDELARDTARLCVQRFDEGLRQGEALYAKGDYQQALDAWRDIQPLFPNNSELEKKLARVHRVLDNLKRLGSDNS